MGSKQRCSGRAEQKQHWDSPKYLMQTSVRSLGNFLQGRWGWVPAWRNFPALPRGVSLLVPGLTCWQRQHTAFCSLLLAMKLWQLWKQQTDSLISAREVN